MVISRLLFDGLWDQLIIHLSSVVWVEIWRPWQFRKFLNIFLHFIHLVSFLISHEISMYLYLMSRHSLFSLFFSYLHSYCTSLLKVQLKICTYSNYFPRENLFFKSRCRTVAFILRANNMKYEAWRLSKSQIYFNCFLSRWDLPSTPSHMLLQPRLMGFSRMFLMNLKWI